MRRIAAETAAANEKARLRRQEYWDRVSGEKKPTEIHVHLRKDNNF